jgi:hypothetical protein
MKKSPRSGRGTKVDKNQKHTSGMARGNLGNLANKIAQRLLCINRRSRRQVRGVHRVTRRAMILPCHLRTTTQQRDRV